MRAVPAQSGASGRVDGELDAGPPAQTARVARDGLHLDVALDPGEAAQLLLHQRRLEQALRGQRDVLEVAAPAPARTGVGTRPLHPVRRGAQHLHGVGAQEVRGLPGHLRKHPLPRQRVPDEDHPAVRGPPDAPTAGRDGADVELERLGHGRSSTVGRRAAPGAEPASSSPSRSAEDRSW